MKNSGPRFSFLSRFRSISKDVQDVALHHCHYSFLQERDSADDLFLNETEINSMTRRNYFDSGYRSSSELLSDHSALSYGM